MEVQEKSGRETYVAIDDVAGLVALMQLGVLEIHPWGCRRDQIDRPDRLVIDLDPGRTLRGPRWSSRPNSAGSPGKGGTARASCGPPAVRGCTWWCLWSGEPTGCRPSGLRERSPSGSRADGPNCSSLHLPSQSGKARSTSITCVTTTAQPPLRPIRREHTLGVPVATPFRWDEVIPELQPATYNVKSVPKRLESLSQDPWAGFFQVRQWLTSQRRSVVARKLRWIGTKCSAYSAITSTSSGGIDNINLRPLSHTTST